MKKERSVCDVETLRERHAIPEDMVGAFGALDDGGIEHGRAAEVRLVAPTGLPLGCPPAQTHVGDDDESTARDSDDADGDGYGGYGDDGLCDPLDCEDCGDGY